MSGTAELITPMRIRSALLLMLAVGVLAAAAWVWTLLSPESIAADVAEERLRTLYDVGSSESPVRWAVPLVIQRAQSNPCEGIIEFYSLTVNETYVEEVKQQLIDSVPPEKRGSRWRATTEWYPYFPSAGYSHEAPNWWKVLSDGGYEILTVTVTHPPEKVVTAGVMVLFPKGKRIMLIHRWRVG